MARKKNQTTSDANKVEEAVTESAVEEKPTAQAKVAEETVSEQAVAEEPTAQAKMADNSNTETGDAEEVSVSTDESPADNTEASAEEEAQFAQTHRPQATKIVNKYSGLGAGAGLIPMPVWDLVAISSVNVMMIKDLYALYGVTFNEKKARTVTSLLLASLSPRLLAGITASSLVKFVPFVGGALATVSMPLLSSASTYVTGNIMISHLEQGGTLDNFDVKEHKAKFSQAVESAVTKGKGVVTKGKKVAESVKQTVKSKKHSA